MLKTLKDRGLGWETLKRQGSWVLGDWCYRDLSEDLFDLCAALIFQFRWFHILFNGSGPRDQN